MTEFRKKYQSFPVDFHLWPQDKIAELWWKEALAWVKSIDSGFCSCGCMNVDTTNSTQEQIEKELQE